MCRFNTRPIYADMGIDEQSDWEVVYMSDSPTPEPYEPPRVQMSPIYQQMLTEIKLLKI